MPPLPSAAAASAVSTSLPARIAALKQIVASIPGTQLRTQGQPQLPDALGAIVGRIEARTGAGAGQTQGSGLGARSQIHDERLSAMQGSLERIVAGRACAEFPLSQRFLAPAHDPLYYKRIRDGVRLAAQGKARSWWKRFFQVKGEA